MYNPNDPQGQQEGYEEDDRQRIDTGLFAPEKIDARWLWDYDYLWLVFEANLRGGKVKRDPKTETWVMDIPKNAQPFMNDDGVKDVMALLRANVNVITGSSIMSEDRVLQWCERMQKDVSDMVYAKMDDYELESSKFLVLVSTIMVAFEGNLRKSINGTGIKYAMQNERRIITQDDTPQNVGIMGKIFGSKKR